MIDKKYVGKIFAPVIADVEVWQLKFFAKAVGETNPIHFDEAAALAAGYRSIVAPPTYSCTLSCAVPDPFAKFIAIGMNLQNILHAQQRFEYFAPICAGDRLIFESTIVEIFDKRAGAIQFVIEEATATNQLGQLTTRIRQTIVEHARAG